jgi:hypothetical protein
MRFTLKNGQIGSTVMAGLITLLEGGFSGKLCGTSQLKDTVIHGFRELYFHCSLI